MVDLAYHRSIQEHLRYLTELDEQVGPAELICGWFDDLYFPSERECPDGYPRETWERGRRDWLACFTDTELQALAEFHQVFKHHLDGLPLNSPGWSKDSGWLAVRDAAKVAVERFGTAA
ncbi:hypothetical protein KJ975_14420 [Myxococcota bacterium]|nr:hypothetical protein [Myxococcota bacterium]